MELKSKFNHPTALERRYAIENWRLLERVPPADIALPRRGARRISKKAVAVATAQLTEVGQQQPLLISESGELVAGHEFLLAAKELGWATVVAVRTVDPARKRPGFRWCKRLHPRRRQSEDEP